MTAGSIRLGTYSGIPVRAHWSMVLVAVLFGASWSLQLGLTVGLTVTVALFASILAHEFGHFKLHHVRWAIVRSVAMSGLVFFGLSLALPLEPFYSAFFLDRTSYGALVVFGLWFGLVSFLLQPLGNALSRRHEFAADAFAPVCFQVPQFTVSWAPTLELTVHIRQRPAPGPVRVAFSSRFIQDGMFEEDGEVWDHRGVLVAQSRQLALIPLPMPG